MYLQIFVENPCKTGENMIEYLLVNYVSLLTPRIKRRVGQRPKGGKNDAQL